MPPKATGIHQPKREVGCGFKSRSAFVTCNTSLLVYAQEQPVERAKRIHSNDSVRTALALVDSKKDGNFWSKTPLILVRLVLSVVLCCNNSNKRGRFRTAQEQAMFRAAFYILRPADASDLEEIIFICFFQKARLKGTHSLYSRKLPTHQ